MHLVLILETDEEFLGALEKKIKAGGYKVAKTSCIFSYFGSPDLITPSIILCKVSANLQDGFVLKEKLNGDNRFDKIPFVFYSGDANIQLIRKGMLLGADDFIVLPVSQEELLNTIKLRISKFTRLSFLNECERKQSIQLSRGKKIFRVLFSEIIHIDSMGDYSTVYTKKHGRFILRKTLKAWMDDLPTSMFFKVHKSYIANLNYIEFVNSDENHYGLKLADDEIELPVSVRQLSKLKELLKV